MLGHQKEEIKNRLNLVDIVSEYITLNKTGANYKALCPFHNEKTPSFLLSEDKQIWHCFGCGLGGDLFEFIMKIEAVDFKEALKLLGSKAGVEISFGVPGERTKFRLYEVLAEAVHFYRDGLLNHPEAALARDYLNKRKITPKTSQNFSLGYSLYSWNALRDHLGKKGYTLEEMDRAGLVVRSSKNSGDYYDRFRGRLMFPIYNSFGNAVGFSARVLDPERDKMGKYINSPQNEIFDKSRILYGLYQAKEAMKRKKEVVIVEGQIDVLSSHQAGVVNTVATSGTALTGEHVKMLSRYVECVQFCFDQDKAGRSALLRASKVVLPTDLKSKVVLIEPGMDPDDLIQKSPEQWLSALEKSPYLMDYYFETLIENIDPNDPYSKKKSVEFILKLLSLVKSQIVVNHYFGQLSSILGVSESYLAAEMNRFSMAFKAGKKQDLIKSSSLKRDDSIFYRFFYFLFYFPVFRARVPGLIKEYLQTSDSWKELYNYYHSRYINDNQQLVELDVVLDFFKEKPEQIQLAQKIFLLGEDCYQHYTEDDLVKEWDLIRKQISRFILKARLVSYQEALRAAERKQDFGLIDRFIKKLSEVTRELSKI